MVHLRCLRKKWSGSSTTFGRSAWLICWPHRGRPASASRGAADVRRRHVRFQDARLAGAGTSRGPGNAVHADRVYRRTRLFLLAGSASPGARAHTATQFDLPGVGYVSLATSPTAAPPRRRIRGYLHGFPGTARPVRGDLEHLLDVRTEPTDNFLSWADLREMRDGVSVIPHGLTHVRLAGLNAEKLLTEIVQPFEDIRAHLDTCLPVYSYPYGSYDRLSRQPFTRRGIPWRSRLAPVSTLSEALMGLRSDVSTSTTAH